MNVRPISSSVAGWLPPTKAVSELEHAPLAVAEVLERVLQGFVGEDLHGPLVRPRRSAQSPRRSRRRLARGTEARASPWSPTERAATERYASDLLTDPVTRFVNSTSLLWVLFGLAVLFGLGVAIGDSIAAGLTGLLWRGAVRVFVLHHVTYSMNSLCHFYGRRRFTTGDQSRNLAWLSVASLSEAWHNNHHAFPTSGFQGLHRFELGPSALVITLLERAGLAWAVVRVSPERQSARALA